jgi:molecular chaperone DnaJ
MRSEWLEKDYYATLGVASDASAKEIKKSFRKLARTHHPDNNPGNADAEECFKEINEAYDVLSDDDQRGEYDEARAMRHAYGGRSGFEQQVRVEDLFGDAAPFDLGDLFSQVRREPRPRRGADLETDMRLSFDETISGVSRSVELDGETFTIKIPKGVGDGARIRLGAKGGSGRHGGPRGDLYVRVHVDPHPFFVRDGRDLRLTVPVNFTEAALGSVIEVPTLDGTTKIRMPAGTPSGKTLRVRAKGVETSKGVGDLLVTVEVLVPATLNDEQRHALEEFHRHDGKNPRVHLGV